MKLWAKICSLFKKEKPKVKPKKEEVGGGIAFNLDRVLSRLDPKSDLPMAVREHAIKNLTAMAGGEVSQAVKTGNLEKAQRIQKALGDIEKNFPKVVENLPKDDKAALDTQKTRTDARVSRLNGTLKNTAGGKSAYGVVKGVDKPKVRDNLL